jgi:hypothetical protein
MNNPKATIMLNAVHPELPLKICIAFDEETSARSAEVLIKHVASDFECETQLFQFAELDPPRTCVAAARSASAADLLIIAVRDDRMLPSHVQSWLGLCLGLRDEDAEGALVVLVPKANETPNPNSSFWDYLETITAISGLSLFPQRPKIKIAEPFRRGPPLRGYESSFLGLAHRVD